MESWETRVSEGKRRSEGGERERGREGGRKGGREGGREGGKK